MNLDLKTQVGTGGMEPSVYWYEGGGLKTQVGTGGMEPSVYLEKLSNLSVPRLPLLYIGIIVVPT